MLSKVSTVNFTVILVMGDGEEKLVIDWVETTLLGIVTSFPSRVRIVADLQFVFVTLPYITDAVAAREALI